MLLILFSPAGIFLGLFPGLAPRFTPLVGERFDTHSLGVELGVRFGNGSVTCSKLGEGLFFEHHLSIGIGI